MDAMLWMRWLDGWVGVVVDGLVNAVVDGCYAMAAVVGWLGGCVVDG